MGADPIPLPRAPKASSANVRAVMQGNRSRDTKPELAVRRQLHARGLRYRVHRRIDLQGGVRVHPDIVFPREQIAVEILGCYWHGCDVHGRRPSASNPEYWGAKIQRNRVRDERNARLLTEAGWLVIQAWEHEPPDQTVAHVAAAVHARRSALDGR